MKHAMFSIQKRESELGSFDTLILAFLKINPVSFHNISVRILTFYIIK